MAAQVRGGGGADTPGDVHVALLRGVNMGGHNRLPMQDFAALLDAAGCRDVRTYIQSGNAVFRAAPALATRLPGTLTAALLERFGLRVPVVLRSAAELRAVVAGNPFAREAAEPTRVHVAFLADAPAAARVARLDPERSPPDRFAVRGREVYLHLPNGAARSKLTTDYLDRTLATTSTGRNWRTVLKLLDLAEG
jgi:uncharacterized protein (DUF1697 family)